VTQVAPAPTAARADDTHFRTQAEQALREANLPSLFAAVVQLTGDLSLLDGPLRPTGMRGPGDHNAAGLPPQAQDALRAKALDVLLAHRAGTLATAPTLTPDEVLDVLSACLDERVPDEQTEMLAEELGVLSRATPVIDRAHGEQPPHVLVVGAGFSGLCAAIRLQEAGVPYTMIERCDDLGGTWHENTYPGCGVDTPIHVYSFSFAQRPDWPRYFARQAEVRDYLRAVASEYGILDRIQFGTTLEQATWNEESQRWNVALTTADGTSKLEFPVVISAVGLFNQPATPVIPGLDAFDGPVVHTAAWDAEVDLTGKRVAVVGSGASAMQLVPAIAGTAAEVVVFQRSAQWIIPNPNTERAVEPGQQFLMTHFPGYLGWYRLRHAWNFGDRLHPMLRIDPNWPHQDQSINFDNERHRRFLTRYISEQLAERPELVDACVPHYPPYGKRPLLDHGWFRTLVREDVRLVPHGVTRVEGRQVVTDLGEAVEVDVIVLATGFTTLDLLGTMTVEGRGGLGLREEWGPDDARAYLGMTVPRFPNLFILYGPNTNAGHGGSHVLSVEMQVRYVLQAIKILAQPGVTSMECRRDVYEAYNIEVDAALDGSIWTHPGMTNYYRNSAGRIVTNIPWTNAEFWRRTRVLDAEDFEIHSAESGATHE
jgi:4-hydroxyacetophenone monooxygenase